MPQDYTTIIIAGYHILRPPIKPLVKSFKPTCTFFMPHVVQFYWCAWLVSNEFLQLLYKFCYVWVCHTNWWFCYPSHRKHFYLWGCTFLYRIRSRYFGYYKHFLNSPNITSIQSAIIYPSLLSYSTIKSANIKCNFIRSNYHFMMPILSS